MLIPCMGCAGDRAGRLGSHAVCSRSVQITHSMVRISGPVVPRCWSRMVAFVGVEPVGYAPPSDCELLDYGNATVLPGLIDSHVRNADAMNIAAKQASSMAGAHRSRTGGSAAAATEWRRRGRAAEDFGSRGTGDEGSTGEEPDLVQHVRPKTHGAEGDQGRRARQSVAAHPVRELRRGAALPRATSTPVVHMIGKPAGAALRPCWAAVPGLTALGGLRGPGAPRPAGQSSSRRPAGQRVSEPRGQDGQGQQRTDRPTADSQLGVLRRITRTTTLPADSGVADVRRHQQCPPPLTVAHHNAPRSPPASPPLWASGG